jgi:sec-independent protein translocase protein TatA
MGGLSIWHWLIVLAVFLLLFARPGKISAVMGDFGKGLKSFKEGLKSNEGAEGTPPPAEDPTKSLPRDGQPGATASQPASSDKSGAVKN